LAPSFWKKLMTSPRPRYWPAKGIALEPGVTHSMSSARELITLATSPLLKAAYMPFTTSVFVIYLCPPRSSTGNVIHRMLWRRHPPNAAEVETEHSSRAVSLAEAACNIQLIHLRPPEG